MSYRMMVIRDGGRVRLISRGGIDYAGRFPRIVEAARKRRHRSINWAFLTDEGGRSSNR
jgi:ATP-dependent DNA ligase